jgi:hypothetical protein
MTEETTPENTEDVSPEEQSRELIPQGWGPEMDEFPGENN